MHERVPTRVLVLVVVVLALVAVVLWTRPGSRPVESAVLVLPPEGPYQACLADTMPAGREFRLSGPLTRVPEANDCQQFIDAAGRYGSVFSIFTRNQLARTVLDSKRAEPVALIHAGGEYGPLGIKEGFNCLLMYRRSARPGDFGAVMVAVRGEEECSAPRAIPDLRSAKPLVSRYVAPPGYSNDDYPEVSRWDRDSLGTYYIDVRCGLAYCEVGPEGLRPFPAGRAPASATTPGERRVYEIKLWYDEQVLAKPLSGGVGPSQVRATLIPDPGIDRRIDLHAAAPSGDPWLPSAVIRLEGGDYPPLNLAAGSNAVALCRGDAGDCLPPQTVIEGAFGSGPCPAEPHDWLRIRSASGAARFYCVRTLAHGATHVPGTARWRWWPTGETAWFKCPEGSCTPW